MNSVYGLLVHTEGFSKILVLSIFKKNNTCALNIYVTLLQVFF